MTVNSKPVTQRGAIEGSARVRQYAGGAKKLSGVLYGGILDRIASLAGQGRLLEVGAGPGLLAVMAAARLPEADITALDLSADMAAVARENVRRAGLEDRIRYVVGDVADADLVPGLGRFDLVYSTFSLHHWERPADSIRNLRRVVAPGGALFIYDFRRVAWLARLPLLGGHIDSLRASLTPSELRAIMRELGVGTYTLAASPFTPFMSLVAR